MPGASGHQRVRGNAIDERRGAAAVQASRTVQVLFANRQFRRAVSIVSRDKLYLKN